MGGWGGEGDIIGLGDVDRLENAVFVCTCGSVCVCAMRMCLCVLDLLVGMGSCGKHPRALHQMSKNMFVFSVRGC